MNIRNKMTMFCLAGALTASVLSTGSVYSYDGDVDYSAPYVTLDPKTGKLITVDPKKDPAAMQQAQQTQHPATVSSDAATSTPAADTANSGGNVASISTEADATTAPARTPTTAVLIAIAAIVIIGLFVAISRRKSVIPDRSEL